MALSPSIPSLLLLQLLLTMVALFISPACSTSRKALDHHQTAETGFRVGLIHVDSKENITKLELVQRAIKRGKLRLQRLSSAMAMTADDNIQSPIHAGSGEFLMNLAIGTPPKPFTAIMDTGSDLIWTQCKPCKECYDQPSPIFDPKQSSSFAKLPCSSNLCKALTMSTCSNGCEYMYTYGDYSSTQGQMATETFKFGDSVSVPRIGFGCGDDNQGGGFSQGSGLVGLGRGPLSLVSQVGSKKFSYCLTSIDETKPSSLLFGSLANLNKSNDEIKSTPLLKNPSHPSFYYLSLEGITVGDTLLSIPESTFALSEDGSGGLIIDSGTTITYLEDTGFSAVKSAFKSKIKLPVADSDTGLDLCFKLPSGSTEVEVPKLVLHFKGADLELPGENYMIADSEMGLLCLAMGASSGMSIMGNVQQQNMLVLHDLEKETLSFVPTKCGQL